MDEVKQKKEYRFVGFRLEHIKAFMVENGLQKWMPNDEFVIRQSTDWLINVRNSSPSFLSRFCRLLDTRLQKPSKSLERRFSQISDTTNSM